MSEGSRIQIQLRDGAIYAMKHNHLISARGVRYANAARFQPPQPIQPWQDVMDCTGPATICPQLPSRLEALNGPIAGGREMDEDCLHVSIYAPVQDSASSLRPVVAFIHGGGYTSGGGDLDCYGGAGLAEIGDVVVVTITYRLGILGYQPIDGVAPANLGLLDQMAALRWIQDNISCFGGDPRRVTLAGASAGGDSIYCLFGADGAEDLFQRAIFQSTPLGVRHVDRDAMVKTLGASAKKMLGDGYSTMGVAEVLSVQMSLAMESRGFAAAGMPFAPTLGHAPLACTQAEFDARVRRALARIPIFIGYCADEGTAFEGIFNAMRPKVRPSFTGSAADFISRSWFQQGSDKLLQQAREAGGEPWFYRLTFAPKESPFKASHTMEMPFLLGNWDAWNGAPMMKSRDAKSTVEMVGPHVKRLWATFARGGDVGRKNFIIDESFFV